MREAYAAAQLTHHNVVQIYDLSSSGQTNFFSMEFVEGRSLAEVVDKQGRLPPAEAIGYTIQAARGLEFAHRHGMIHRNVKPANLLLNDQGIVKVADLGLVKTPQLLESEGDQPPAGDRAGVSLADARANVTIANVAMGTPAYMSPEQAENAAGVDHRADIYSLGCTLYALLTGQPPFQGATVLEVITRHKTAPVVRPDALVKGLPPGLSEIVLKMVAKNPGQRYQTLGEAIGDLEDFLAKSHSGRRPWVTNTCSCCGNRWTSFKDRPRPASRSRPAGLLWALPGGCRTAGAIRLAVGHRCGRLGGDDRSRLLCD